MGLAEELIESWTDKHFDFSHYVDQYEEDVRKLIDAKVHGRDIVMPEEEEEPAVYNLMDALRKSMAQTPSRPRFVRPSPPTAAANAAARHSGRDAGILTSYYHQPYRNAIRPERP